MAWIRSVERENDKGRRQPSRVAAFVKAVDAENGAPVIRIDASGSEDRNTPGRQSRTRQFGKESTKHPFDILEQTQNFQSPT